MKKLAKHSLLKNLGSELGKYNLKNFLNKKRSQMTSFFRILSKIIEQLSY